MADYRAIVGSAASGAEVVLGGVWYYNDPIERATMQGLYGEAIEHEVGKMPFDSNAAEWRIYHGVEIEAVLHESCADLDLPFFMRSGPALAGSERTPPRA